ncbi:aspartate kinase [Opitutia bacterium]|nr:aspartate kinase [Opitutae bacterium]
MALIVQKYGGTSVGNVDRIQNVAAKIKEQWSRGHRLVVVVSARSGVTNDLIARAKALQKLPDEREMDVLMAVGEQETIALTVMALHAIGVPAVSARAPRPASSPTTSTPAPASPGSPAATSSPASTRARWSWSRASRA